MALSHLAMHIPAQVKELKLIFKEDAVVKDQLKRISTPFPPDKISYLGVHQFHGRHHAHHTL
jgi:urease accessory protein UreE